MPNVSYTSVDVALVAMTIWFGVCRSSSMLPFALPSNPVGGSVENKMDAIYDTGRRNNNRNTSIASI